MLLINAVFLIDKLRVAAPTVLLTGAWVPFATVSLGLNSVSLIIPRRAWLWLNNRLYESYMRLWYSFIRSFVKNVLVYSFLKMLLHHG